KWKFHRKHCASTQLLLGHFVRLACLRHAASVHPEPGSNSPKKYLFLNLNCLFLTISELTFCSVFKDHSCSPFLKSKPSISNQKYKVNTFFKKIFIFFNLTFFCLRLMSFSHAT
ncbi:MAG: hypothetical protein E7174_03065, partial [Firmicutes bacterium]|nr:hypothetical protein [Bacillota bacterium]